MRFMILLKADKNTEAGVSPSTELSAAVMKYNEELTKAGVLLAGEGLQPSSKGTRVKYSAGKRTVIDGPFPELRELIAGFWMFQVNSREEAIEGCSMSPHTYRVAYRCSARRANDHRVARAPPHHRSSRKPERAKIRRFSAPCWTLGQLRM